MGFRTPRAVLLCALSALSAAPAWAQAAGTAALEIRVGQEQAGSRARLSSLETPWSAVASESAGVILFADVPPGSYRVGLEGGGPGAEREVALRPGERLALRLRRGSTAGLDPVDEITIAGTAFDRERLEALPSSRDAWSLLETVETVAIGDRMDTGGLYAGEPGRASLHGTSWTQTSLRIGGLDATDPFFTGRPLFEPPLEALEAVEAATAASPASLRGPGPTITLVPRRPRPAWHAALQAHAAVARGGPGDAAAPPIARLASWRRAAATADGPLHGERLGLLVSATAGRSGRFERGDPIELDNRFLSGLAHLVWRPGSSNEGRLLLGLQDARRPFAGRARLADSATDESARLAHAQAVWESRRESGALGRLALGFQRATADTGSGPFTPQAIERLRDGPVHELALPGRIGRRRLDAEVMLAAAPRRAFGLRHALSGGLALGRLSAESQPADAATLTAERVDGLAARSWLHQTPGTWGASATEMAAWLSDRIALADALDVEAGLRIEMTRAEGDGGAPSLRWSRASPRVAARWRLTRPGAVALLGSYGLYAHRLPLGLLAWGHPAAPRADVHRWRDLDGDGQAQPSELGLLIARMGPGAPVGHLDAPFLTSPCTRQLTVGLEAAAGPLAVRLLGIDQRERNLVESINVGEADYVQDFVADPGGDLVGTDDDQLLSIFRRLPASFGRDRYLLLNPRPEHRARHQGVELTFELRGRRAQMLLGLTAHRSEGDGANRGFRPAENDQGLVGELFDQPNTLPVADRVVPSRFAPPRLFSDRAYTIKWSGSWRAPGDLRLGVAARYQDGQPFSRLVIPSDLPQGPEPVEAVPNGRHRFEFAITVDARVEKAVRVGAQRLVASLEAFNLLDNAHEVEEYVVSGPRFRTPTARQPPRVVRIGLRLEL